MSFATIHELKLLLDIDESNTNEDETLDMFLTLSEDVVKEYTGSTFTSATTSALYDGTGTNELFLKNPVLTFTVLKRNSSRKTVLESTTSALTYPDDYVYYPNVGKVLLNDSVFTKGLQNIYIEYVSGYSSTPTPIKQATLELAIKSYKDHRQGRFGVNSKALSSNATVRDDFVRTYLTPSTKSLLDLYRNPLEEGEEITL